ncbi:hypothetical protein BN14_12393 [Rhizoctonia solani AG-1 IB]|uniref:DDE-1 domain-containing protein n=1 Tax=Thanatephorus cucumeris (strain AG1-IB / isolate 7/3/14) TaxID=1108050 RepID=M5CA57_THACB|nr:hypothetical protein BN14_06770 [Rhizoctonia solani AG-1 IB]CCO38225.1 hypothetical protein BN14_12393 [Rhizoctonia solani AG-1 IB]
MKLAATAWDAVTPITIANCWRHARLALPIAPDVNASPDNTLDAESSAQNEAQALQEEMAHHPNLLEPEFVQMMEALTLSQPTEREFTDTEIVEDARIMFSA